MSIAAEKVAEVLALPERDRAFLAHQLIASLEDTVDPDAETQWVRDQGQPAALQKCDSLLPPATFWLPDAPNKPS